MSIRLLLSLVVVLIISIMLGLVLIAEKQNSSSLGYLLMVNKNHFPALERMGQIRSLINTVNHSSNLYHRQDHTDAVAAISVAERVQKSVVHIDDLVQSSLGSKATALRDSLAGVLSIAVSTQDHTATKERFDTALAGLRQELGAIYQSANGGGVDLQRALSKTVNLLSTMEAMYLRYTESSHVALDYLLTQFSRLYDQIDLLRGLLEEEAKEQFDHRVEYLPMLEQISKLRKLISRWEAVLRLYAAEAVSMDPSASQVEEAFNLSGLVQRDILTAFLVLQGQVMVHIEEEEAGMIESARYNRMLLLWLGAFGVLVAVIGSIVTIRSIIGSVRILTTGAEAYSKHRWSYRSPLPRLFEFRKLAVAFNYMASTLEQDIARRERVEQELKQSSIELVERNKEIGCLFSMAQVIETPGLDEYELCRRGVKIIPSGWQYLEITRARITLDGSSFSSKEFEQSPWRQAAEIQVNGVQRGEIEVFYLEQKPELDEGPFRKEERELLQHLAVQLSEALARIAADRTIRDSEQQNRLLLESTSDGIYAIDLEGVCTICNPAAARILGYESPELVVGKHAHTLFHHSHPDGSAYPWEECFLERVLEGEILLEGELFWGADGSPIPVECHAAPIRRRGEVVGSVISFSDLTERHMAEVRLRQAQKLESIGQLAAGIAHEINTPIQFVTDNTKFLQEALEDYQRLLTAYEQLHQAPAENRVRGDLDKQINDLAEEIDLQYLQKEIPQAIDQSLEGLGRIARIVRAMKEFSHPGMEEKTPADINQALETTINVSRNEWKYHAEVETDLDPRLPLVSCLPGEINQVFLNLITNAAHAIANVVGESGDKGIIRITTSLDDAWVEIRVSDSGTGVPEEIKQRIFDPFFTTKEVGKGTGQGLAIAYSAVVDKHGGSLDLESKVGIGATFIIRLPLEGSSDNKN